VKLQKKLAFFYIFGYLLEFRIECDEFFLFFFKLDFFPMLVKSNSKNIITIWENFDQKKCQARVKANQRKSIPPLCVVMFGDGMWMCTF
jgi:hypothetical protein